jgi:hypothetical protein
MEGRAVQVLRSNGENEARAYAKVEVRPSAQEPEVEVARVRIVDPRHTSTVTRGARRAGPRNPQQDVWPARKPPGVDLPDGRPATKAQRVMIDPELVAQWRAEAKMKESA